jgi:DNA-binding response OmpR family regulator
MPRPLRSHPHIANIEADAGVRELLVELLDTEAYRTTSYRRMPRLTEIVSLAPDLIVLDLSLDSTRTSATFLQDLEGSPETSHVPVVVCTGWGAVARGEHVIVSMMAAEVVAKLFDVDSLLGTIGSVLRRSPGPDVSASSGL